MGEVSPPSELCSQHFSLIFAKTTLAGSPIQAKLGQLNIYISIVSNSHLLREALILLLKNHHSIHLVESYTSEVDIIPTLANPSNHLILIDSGIGKNITITQIQSWRSLQPSPQIIVLELQNDIDLILSCIEAGAQGYALQGASSREVIQVIEQVHQGIARCSPEVTAKLFDRLVQLKTVQQSKEKPLLTRRELEVLHCLAKNYSDREIALELIVEVRTVKHHVHNVLRKLNVKHRWDAARLASEHRWLDLTPS